MPFSASSLIAFSFLVRWVDPMARSTLGAFENWTFLVPHDLDAVAPGIVEIKERSRQSLDARLSQCAAHGFFVFDDESEMSAVSGTSQGVCFSVTSIVWRTYATDPHRTVTVLAICSERSAIVSRQCRFFEFHLLVPSMARPSGVTQ